MNIFTAIHNELVIKCGISWHNCVTFCSDNASVMMGVQNKNMPSREAAGICIFMR